MEREWGGGGERERSKSEEREGKEREKRERHTHKEKRGERLGGMECGWLAPAQRQTKHWLGAAIIADKSCAQQFISTDNTHQALFFG